MATRIWKGGTTAVAQVSTMTIGGTWSASGEDIVVTYTLEDGSTETSTLEDCGSGGTSTTQVATTLTAHLAALTNAAKPNLASITWTSAAAVVTGTAKSKGKPFTVAGAPDTGSGTVVEGTTTANAGPNDWNTAANWQGGAKPTASNSDKVIFDSGDYDVLYGLDQNAIDVTSLHIAPSYTGTIGDPANSFYLKFDPTTAYIETGGKGVWLDCTSTTTLVIKGCAPGSKSIMLDGTITNLIATGRNVLGTTNVKDTPAVTNVYLIDAPNAHISIGSGTNVITLTEMNSGRITTGCDATTVNVNGGIYRNENTIAAATAAIDTLNVRNGTAQYAGMGDVTQANVYGGLLDYRETSGNTGEANVIITAMSVFGGKFRSDNGQNHVTFTANPLHYGGEIHIDRGVNFQYAI